MRLEDDARAGLGGGGGGVVRGIIVADDDFIRVEGLRRETGVNAADNLWKERFLVERRNEDADLRRWEGRFDSGYLSGMPAGRSESFGPAGTGLSEAVTGMSAWPPATTTSPSSRLRSLGRLVTEL